MESASLLTLTASLEKVLSVTATMKFWQQMVHSTRITGTLFTRPLSSTHTANTCCHFFKDGNQHEQRRNKQQWKHKTQVIAS